MSIYKETGVYEIVDHITGKTYVGQTMYSLGNRRDSHFALLRHHRHWVKPLQDVWDATEGEAISFEVVAVVSDQNIADMLEITWIEHYQSQGLSLNTMQGGKYAGWAGLHLSDDAKRRIGEKNHVHGLGRKASAETKAKMSASQKKRCHSPMTDEAKANMREAQQKGLFSAKLTAEDVRQIRRRRETTNESYSTIAADYGVTAQCINDICLRKRWSHIE